MFDSVYSLISINIMGVTYYWSTGPQVSFKGRTWELFDGTVPTVVQRGDNGAKSAGLRIPNTKYQLGQAIVVQGVRSVFPRTDPVSIYDAVGVSGGSPVDSRLIFQGFVNNAPEISEMIALSCIGYDSDTDIYPKHMITSKDFDYLVEDGFVFSYGNENYVFNSE